MEKNNNNNFLNISLISIMLFIIFFVLYIWSSLIIPFIIALLFSFAIIWLSNFFKSFKIPAFFSFIFSITTYILIFWWLGKMLGSNIQDLIRLLPEYQIKIWMMISQIFNYLHISEPWNMSEVLSWLDLQYIFTLALNWFTSAFSNAWIIFIYVLFILLEYRFFKEKLNLVITSNVSKKNIFETIYKIKRDVQSYFVIKTMVSLIAAILSYIIMKMFWLDFALFWSLLLFILKFIPNIGVIIAVLLASLFSLIQFDTYYPFLFIITGLTSIQAIMWNIIEPRFMWNKLNLSPLVIIMSLWFWWAIWWIIWMLLSVPIMVIINIILSKIPATRNIAVLLSEKWELDVDWWIEAVKTRKRIISRLIKKIMLK